MRSKLVIMSALATAVAAVAMQTVHANDDVSAGPAVTLYTGAELDTADSRRIDLGISLESSRQTTFDLAGSQSVSELDADEFSSTLVRAELVRDFGRFGAGGGILQVDDEDVLDMLAWRASAFLDVGASRFTAGIDYRTSDFADSPFSASGAELGLPSLASVSGIAACSIDSLGYRIGVSTVGERAALYGSVTLYDYSSYECDAAVQEVTAVPGTRAAVLVRRPRLARQLVANAIASRQGYSGTLAPREATLLETAVSVGANYALGTRITLGAELYRDTEEFAAVESVSLLGYAEWQLTQSLALELTAGATDTDFLDSSAFAGVRLSATLD